MQSQSTVCLQRLAGRAAVALVWVFATSAHATVDPVDVTVGPVLNQVSVSAPGKQFLAGYTVTVNNQTDSPTGNFVLWGRARAVLADGSVGAPAAFASSPQSPAECVALSQVIPGFGEFLVRCEFQSAAVGESKFTLNFQTPTAGDPANPVKSLRFEWVNTRPWYGLNNLDSGAALVGLITQPQGDINTSLTTVVPSSGLTVFTGTFGNGGPGNPGSAATRTDPFTTTVVIPPFNFAPFTTASIAESTGVFSCSPGFSQCYLTDLNIPGVFASLEIYLRVDVSRITPAGNINTAQLEYIDSNGNTSPINNCLDGQPNSNVKRCIESRKRYPLSGSGLPGDAWKGDWEFKIKALENGKVRFL